MKDLTARNRRKMLKHNKKPCRRKPTIDAVFNCELLKVPLTGRR